MEASFKTQKKTKVSIFKRGGKSSWFEKWHFDGKEVKVTAIKYLGITWSQNGSFASHFSSIADKALKHPLHLYRKQINLSIYHQQCCMNCTVKL